ncbi:MAG: aldehyde dehydrogenase family protein [Nanoarchaeota archaeon]|nr:aldehyde dehydrogenase family protein [Nanoarchaeota archaeon]
MIINGKRVRKEKNFEVRSPYDGSLIGEVPIAEEKDIMEAIFLSHEMNKDLPINTRANILTRTAERVIQEKQTLATLISYESGLSLRDSNYEIDRVHSVFAIAAEYTRYIEEDITCKFISSRDGKPKLQVITEPFDLILAITPFNHPMNQVAHKVAPAIAAGTAIVLKPSEKTPLSAIKLIEIMHECGLPPNYVNLITTNNPSSFLDIALSTKLAQVLTFTGGIKVGKYIARRLIETDNELIKYVPELGDNAALAILEDADLDLSARVALHAFTNSGQRCTSIKRILVHNDIADKFIENFLDLSRKIKYGDPLDPENDMGTLIDQDSAIQIQKRVEDSLKKGARLLYGNIRDRALYSPTILDHVNPASELVVEETFGPIAPIIRINSLEEAISIINSVNYKLSGAVITRDKKKAKFIANSIKVGQFSWNGHPGYRTEQAPFGGFGLSGNGQKEGVIMAAESMRRIRTFYTH